MPLYSLSTLMRLIMVIARMYYHVWLLQKTSTPWRKLELVNLLPSTNLLSTSFYCYQKCVLTPSPLRKTEISSSKLNLCQSASRFSSKLTDCKARVRVIYMIAWMTEDFLSSVSRLSLVLGLMSFFCFHMVIFILILLLMKTF